MSVFDPKIPTQQQSFFGQPLSIARYDRHFQPIFEKLTKQQLSYFWLPEEIPISKDSHDFRNLSSAEQHIFTSNLKRQIMLDSIQGRSPALALLPIVSLPELENWILAWSFFETIHSRSYTYLIQNIYPDPSGVFDQILNLKEVVDCASDISHYYDELIKEASYWNLLGEGTHSINGNSIKICSYELKKKLWLTLMSINVLEGIRFYVSFACAWSFTEQKKTMEGNAKIMKFIARDENLHLASTQHLLKLLPKENKDFAKIEKETRDECMNIFEKAASQEKLWANYLFQEGSMLGLNEEMLSQYVEWLANKRLQAIGMSNLYEAKSNPLPWTQKWIAGKEVQVAPQEVPLSSYTVGSIKQDVAANTFSDFTL